MSRHDQPRFENTADDDSNGTFTFRGDQERLVQVMVNLLANAVKFTPANSTVTINAMPADDAIELSVTDCGHGVPENMQEAIFEKFKQVERNDETKKGGTGLGLAICKAIVERHGEKIGVRSKPGDGSQFWFQMPAAETVVELPSEAPSYLSCR